MARYIDADALTAEFKRLTLGENSLIERMFADGVYAVIETFPSADVAPRVEWISVDERLPDRQGVYIVSMRDSEYENIVYLDAMLYALGEWRNLPDKFTVSHWMPLPKLPKGD